MAARAVIWEQKSALHSLSSGDVCMKLTKAALRSVALPEGKGDHVLWDEDLPGFGLRLRAGGSRTWIVRYRFGAKQRVVKLGRADVLDPDKARKLARETLAKRELGADPQGERRLARERSAVTLGSIADLYFERHVTPRLRPRPAAEVRRHLEKHWAPLHRLPIDKVDRRQIAARLAELTASSGPIAANRSRTSLAALFGWAMRQGFVETNPVIATAPPGEERSRDRVLSLAELAEVWHAADRPGDFCAIVRLLILTGARRAEVAGLSRPELNGQGMWELPASRSKNGRPHLVPLPRQALAILEALPRRPDRTLVFGEAAGPFSGWSQAKAALDRRLLENRRAAAAQAGLDPAAVLAPPHWTLHDIRRSVVTHMNELGVPPHVVEAAVNHVSGTAKAGVAGIYNKATYLPEKAAALARWAERLAEELEDRGRKRVPIRA